MGHMPGLPPPQSTPMTKTVASSHRKFRKTALNSRGLKQRFSLDNKAIIGSLSANRNTLARHNCCVNQNRETASRHFVVPN